MCYISPHSLPFNTQSSYSIFFSSLYTLLNTLSLQWHTRLFHVLSSISIDPLPVRDSRCISVSLSTTESGKLSQPSSYFYQPWNSYHLTLQSYFSFPSLLFDRREYTFLIEEQSLSVSLKFTQAVTSEIYLTFQLIHDQVSLTFFSWLWASISWMTSFNHLLHNFIISVSYFLIKLTCPWFEDSFTPLLENWLASISF